MSSSVHKRTASARGAAVPGMPDERGITFRVTTGHYKRIKDVALKNRRTISQECAWRVLASIEAEEKAK